MSQPSSKILCFNNICWQRFLGFDKKITVSRKWKFLDNDPIKFLEFALQ